MNDFFNTVLILARNEYCKNEIVYISNKLSEKGIRSVVLKGAFLNDILYSKKYLKNSYDIDILVEECNLQQAWEILSIEYTPFRNSQIYIDFCHSNNCKSMGVNHLAVLSPKNTNNFYAHPVELHFSISSTYYADFGKKSTQYNLKNFDVFSHTETINYINTKLLVLNPTLQFWVLLLHFSSHLLTNLREHIVMEKPLSIHSNLLKEIRYYWESKKDVIDILTIYHWAKKWNRVIETLLPLHIISDIPIPVIFYEQNIECLENGIDFIRQIIPLFFRLTKNDFTNKQFEISFHTLVRNQWKGEKVFLKGYSFLIPELIGMRYHQTKSNYVAKCKLNLNKDIIEFNFSNLRYDKVKNDYDYQQQFEVERGNPGIYITIYDNKRLQKTYLYSFDKNNVLFHGDSINPYKNQIICSTNQTKDKITIKVSINQLGLNLNQEFGISAVFSAFEPYFHMVNLNDYTKFILN